LPEPSRKIASQVEAVVRATDSDLGFLLNSDGSRISFVDEKGVALNEEMTLPLCLLSLNQKIKRAVTTVVSSSLSDWVAAKTGISLIRTRVGQSSVVHMMEAENAEAGGEGSGSFAIKRFSRGYDALLSLVLLLDLLAREDKKLTDIVQPFPVKHMCKIKIEVPPEKTYRIMDRLEEIYSHEKPNFIDGIRIDRDKAWFNIRPSLTEFIIRLTIESEHQEIIRSIEEEIRERILV
jgi:phosphomannomutase